MLGKLTYDGKNLRYRVVADIIKKFDGFIKAKDVCNGIGMKYLIIKFFINNNLNVDAIADNLIKSVHRIILIGNDEHIGLDNENINRCCVDSVINDDHINMMVDCYQLTRNGLCIIGDPVYNGSSLPICKIDVSLPGLCFVCNPEDIIVNIGRNMMIETWKDDNDVLYAVLIFSYIIKYANEPRIVRVVVLNS